MVENHGFVVLKPIFDFRSFFVQSMFIFLTILSLLNKLLIKDPRDRLCCTGNDPTQGASELKNTSFFQDVNWDIMKNMGYPAPMIPPRGEVNAHDAFDIGNFDDDETKGIKLSDQDQKMWDNFHVVVSDRWQREIGETVFDQVNSESDRAEEKRRKGKGSKYPGGDDAQGKSRLRLLFLCEKVVNST